MFLARFRWLIQKMFMPHLKGCQTLNQVLEREERIKPGSAFEKFWLGIRAEQVDGDRGIRED